MNFRPAPDHPTHHFHATEEGYLCHDCDARPGRAPNACPAFVDAAKEAHAGMARLLLRSLPPAPAAPPADAGAAAFRAWDQAADEWRTELDVREALCRSLGRQLGLDVDSDDTLTMMGTP